MIEIFSHDASFGPDEEAEEVFVISGKTWDEEPFKLYLKRNDARNLIWQMSFYVNQEER